MISSPRTKNWLIGSAMIWMLLPYQHAVYAVQTEAAEGFVQRSKVSHLLNDVDRCIRISALREAHQRLTDLELRLKERPEDFDSPLSLGVLRIRILYDSSRFKLAEKRAESLWNESRPTAGDKKSSRTSRRRVRMEIAWWVAMSRIAQLGDAGQSGSLSPDQLGKLRDIEIRYWKPSIDDAIELEDRDWITRLLAAYATMGELRDDVEDQAERKRWSMATQFAIDNVNYLNQNRQRIREDHSNLCSWTAHVLISSGHYFDDPERASDYALSLRDSLGDDHPITFQIQLAVLSLLERKQRWNELLEWADEFRNRARDSIRAAKEHGDVITLHRVQLEESKLAMRVFLARRQRSTLQPTSTQSTPDKTLVPASVETDLLHVGQQLGEARDFFRSAADQMAEDSIQQLEVIAYQAAAQQELLDLIRMRMRLDLGSAHGGESQSHHQLGLLNTLFLDTDSRTMHGRVLVASDSVRRGLYQRAKEVLGAVADSGTPSALEYFRDLVQPDDPLTLARVNLLHAEIEREMGAAETSQEFISAAMAALGDSPDQRLELRCRLAEGRLLLAQGRYFEAERVLKSVADDATGWPEKDDAVGPEILDASTRTLPLRDREAFCLATLDLASIARAQLDFERALRESERSYRSSEQLSARFGERLPYALGRAESILSALVFSDGTEMGPAVEIGTQVETPETLWQELQKILRGAIANVPDDSDMSKRLLRQIDQLRAMFHFHRYAGHFDALNQSDKTPGSPEDFAIAEQIWQNTIAEETEAGNVRGEKLGTFALARARHYLSRLQMLRLSRESGHRSEWTVKNRILEYQRNLNAYNQRKKKLQTTSQQITEEIDRLPRRPREDGNLRRLRNKINQLKTDRDELEQTFKALNDEFGLLTTVSGEAEPRLLQTLDLAKNALQYFEQHQYFPHLHYGTLCNLGEIHQFMGENDLSRERFEAAVDVVNRMRHQVSGDFRLRARFVRRFSVAYDRLVDSYTMNSGSQEDLRRAIFFSEQKRVRGLIDAMRLREHHSGASKMTDAAAKQQVESIDQTRHQLLMSERNPNVVAVIDEGPVRQEIADDADGLDLVRSITDIEQLTERPETPWTLLYYHLSDSCNYAFHISNGTIFAIALETPTEKTARKAFRRTVREFAHNFRSGGYDAHPESEALRFAEDIGSRVFPKPLLDRLTASAVTSESALLILPDGDLYDIPFEPLRVRTSVEQPVRFAIECLPPIAYAPSLDWLAKTIKPQIGAKADAVLVAVAKQKFDNIENVGSGRRFQDVEQTAITATSVRDLAESTGIAAKMLSDRSSVPNDLPTLSNIERVLRTEGRPVTFLHIATHGVGPQGANEGFLQLEPEDRAGQESGRVTAQDIERFPLDECELVTLHACSTADGERQLSSEMPDTIMRAFLAAGAKRVIGSHREIDAKKSGEILERFYQLLLTSDEYPGRFAAELRRAKLHSLRQGSAVRDWAPLVLFGAPTDFVETATSVSAP